MYGIPYTIFSSLLESKNFRLKKKKKLRKDTKKQSFN